MELHVCINKALLSSSVPAPYSRQSNGLNHWKASGLKGRRMRDTTEMDNEWVSISMRNLLTFSTFYVLICKWWTFKILQPVLCTLILCGLCFYRAEDLLIFQISFIPAKATTWSVTPEKLNIMYFSMVLYNSTSNGIINGAYHYHLCLFFGFAIWTNPLND